MTSIFNLPDNIDNVEEKLDLDDLYERKKQADLSNLELFNKILSKIHQKIKKTSTLFKDQTFCWYVIPEVMIGVPKYDQGQCIGYVVEKLRENGFNIRYFHPNTVLISWGHWIPSYVRDEIKKKLNKKIDGYGNIVEDKPEKTGNSDVDNMFKLNESREKAENTKFRSVDTYRPSGKFIYNMDFFNNEK
jgi:hypothetical protein